jgi:cytochrome c5
MPLGSGVEIRDNKSPMNRTQFIAAESMPSEETPPTTSTPSSEPPRSPISAPWPFPYPLWSYFLVGLMVVALFSWPFILLTLRTVHQLSYWTTYGWFVGSGWAWLTSFALFWSVVNIYWSKKSLTELKVLESYGHVAISICCGLAVLGLHWISATRSNSEGPQIVDSQALLPAEASEEMLSGPIYGRAPRGKAWFSLTCVTCHGPTGDGINQLAPSLKESEFLKTANAVDINLLIRRGRPITDPFNKSGKPMPARGGDATISDEKVADLVAFVMSLHSRTADPDSLSWDGVEAAPPTLSRKSFVIRPQNPTVRQTNIGVLSLHAGFVSFVMLLSCHLLFGWMRGWPIRRCRPWIFVTTWGWLVALLSWLLILFFLAMIDSQILEWLT